MSALYLLQVVVLSIAAIGLVVVVAALAAEFLSQFKEYR